jgi:hypothetical protein
VRVFFEDLLFNKIIPIIDIIVTVGITVAKTITYAFVEGTMSFCNAVVSVIHRVSVDGVATFVIVIVRFSYFVDNLN